MGMISILVLIAIPIFAVLKVSIQGAASKHGIKTIKDSLVFTGIYFLSLAVFVAIFFFREVPDRQTIVYALLNGLVNVVFQVCYILALNSGPVAITGTIIYFNMLLPVMFGFVYLNEDITLVKIIGIVLILVAFVLLSKKEKNKKFSIKWFLLTMCAFFGGGLVVVIQSFFKTLPCAGQRNEYLVINYLFAAVVCFGISLLFRMKEQTKMIANRYTVGGPILIGVVLGMHQILSMYGLAIMEVSVFSPVTGALTIIFLLVAGIFLFKERPTFVQYIGIGIGIVAVILLNL